MRKRTVITGTGTISPYGRGTEVMMMGLESDQCSLSVIPEDMKINNVDCHVAGFVPKFDCEIPRELRRSMSPMSIFAYLAAKEAVEQAGLEEEHEMGVCIGSTMGSGQEISAIFDELWKSGNLDKTRSMAFFKIMAHTASSSVAHALHLKGRTINPVSACAAGLQAIGLGYEAIAFGREKRMLCGGTEEYSFLSSATFDKIYAASSSKKPDEASMPFDSRRTGVICSEGAGVLCLEELEEARKRNANILAEVKGFATLSSPSSIAAPDPEAACECMRKALEDAGVESKDITYINAHATGTMGDISESVAIGNLFGATVPVSSLKGHLGHTLAASGALETIACVKMMQKGRIVGMRENFHKCDDCAKIWYARTGDVLKRGYILKNSFALGGIYASIVLEPWDWRKDDQ